MGNLHDFKYFVTPRTKYAKNHSLKIVHSIQEFSTFLTTNFFKIRVLPQTICGSKIKFNIFLFNKHHLIKIYDYIIRVVSW